MQHPRPLGKHFCSQEDCTVICWETTCLQTTHCNHSLTDCWRLSKNCLLINKQTDNMTTCCSQSESVCTSECNLSAMCLLAIGAWLNWLPTDCFLVVLLYKLKITAYLPSFAVKLPSSSNYITMGGRISNFQFLVVQQCHWEISVFVDLWFLTVYYS